MGSQTAAAFNQRPLAASEGAAQFFQLAVNGGIVGIGYGLGDFRAQVAAEAVAEAVDGLAGGGVGQLQHLAEGVVAAFVFDEAEEGSEGCEMVGAASGGEVFIHAREGELEHAQRPLAVEDFLCAGVRRGGAQAGFRGFGVEGEKLAAAAFCARGVAEVVGDAALEHAEEEGAQASGAGAGFCEQGSAVFEEVVEEALRHIFGVLDIEAAAAAEGVERLPVEAAEFLQRGGVLTVRGHDEAPARERERGGGFRQVGHGGGLTL